MPEVIYQLAQSFLKKLRVELLFFTVFLVWFELRDALLATVPSVSAGTAAFGSRPYAPRIGAEIRMKAPSSVYSHASLAQKINEPVGKSINVKFG